MIAADAMTDAVLDAAVAAHTDVTEDDAEHDAEVDLGVHQAKAIATWSWDCGSVWVSEVRCGDVVLDRDDLSDSALLSLQMQIAMSLRMEAP